MGEVSIPRCLWLSVVCGYLLASLLTGEQPFIQPSEAAHQPAERAGGDGVEEGITLKDGALRRLESYPYVNAL